MEQPNETRSRYQASTPSRKRLARLAAFSFVLIAGFGLLGFVSRNAILNRFARAKVEQAFTDAHPGYALHLSDLHYTVRGRQLVAQSVTVSATNLTLEAGPVSLAGVHWSRLLWGSSNLTDVLSTASFEATNITIEFPATHYGIRCTRLRANVPDSELVAENTELRTLIGDEEFFAAQNFRTTRFHAFVPECRVLGLDFGALFHGKSYRAGLITLSRMSFDALVNRDKQPAPHDKLPLMVHEALAAISTPLQIDALNITNGHATYRERVVTGAEPGVLTFADVNMSVTNIANRGEELAAIQLQAESELMNDGALKFHMTIPIAPSDLSFHYSGSLGPMDATRLDAFLDIAEHLRLKSGNAEGVVFDVDVTDGTAQGRVRAIYDDLVVAVLDKKTGTESGFKNRFASLVANALKVEKSNGPDATGATKAGKVNYTRKPNDTFLQFTWFALRSGLLDAINQ